MAGRCPAGARLRPRTRRGGASWCWCFGWRQLYARRAGAMAGLVAGGRHSGLTLAGVRDVLQRARAGLPQPTCIPSAWWQWAGGGGCGCGRASELAEGRSGAARTWHARWTRGDPSGGCARRRLRWVAACCWFALQARGGCVMCLRAWRGGSRCGGSEGAGCSCR